MRNAPMRSSVAQGARILSPFESTGRAPAIVPWGALPKIILQIERQHYPFSDSQRRAHALAVALQCWSSSRLLSASRTDHRPVLRFTRLRGWPMVQGEIRKSAQRQPRAGVREKRSPTLMLVAKCAFSLLSKKFAKLSLPRRPYTEGCGRNSVHYGPLCPELARADISPKKADSRFDPSRKLSVHRSSRDNVDFCGEYWRVSRSRRPHDQSVISSWSVA
jgi:hypothetical protein